MSLHGIDILSDQTSAIYATDRHLTVANYVWDTNTLSWIRESQGAGGGPSSNVSVIDTVGLTNSELRAAPIETTASNYAKRVDDLTSTMYIGLAPTSSGEGASVWQIKRITFSGTLILEHWADGDALFNNVWTNRASLTYS